jgi:hypothetical protein
MPVSLAPPPSSVKESDGQVSPTSNGARLALSPSSVNSNTSMRDHSMSDLFDYRRDLAILDPAGGRSSRNQHNNPSTGSLGQIAPWMTGNGSTASPAAPPDPAPATFYNDSTDNLSLDSRLSPGIRTSISRATPAGSTDSPDAAYFTDERRPSVASITTTASSQGSRTSGARGGIRKLQGFFGEEFPGRDSSETSLGQGKEHRSHSYSYSRPHRDRNYSNATDHGRDNSPASRPRTPVPAPEVVPFLYQEADVRDATPQSSLSLDTILSFSFLGILPCQSPNATLRATLHLASSLSHANIMRLSNTEPHYLGHCPIRGSPSSRHPQRPGSRPLHDRRCCAEPAKNFWLRPVRPFNRAPTRPSQTQ